MLTGHLPFESKHPEEVARDIILTPPPLPSSFNPALPLSIYAFFSKALSKVKNTRFQTAKEMMLNLTSYI
jgi:serine/threonine protein kinase